MRHVYLIICFLIVSNFSSNAQRLISTTLLESFTSEELAQTFGIPTQFGVDVHSVLYYTPHLDGELDTASGLFVIPKSFDTAHAILCYQHGTVGSRFDVPSRRAGGYQLGLIFGATGFSTVMPDYIGLGDSKGLHPYIHGDTEASAGVDLIRALREFAEQEPEVNVHEQIYVSGYSQGGHASMALHKHIEEELGDEMVVTSAAHSSGPYSVSGKMIDFTLGEENYFTPAYLAWVTLAMKAAYPDMLAEYEVSNVFKEQYVDVINQFANEEITLWSLNDQLIAALLAEHEAVRPRDLLTESALNALLNDPEDPLFQVLTFQDNYDWSPQSSTRIYYCTEDEQVTFENAILADSIMQLNGASDLVAINQGELDHGGCVTPATTATLFHFLSTRRIDQILSTETLVEAEKYIKATEIDGQLYVMVNPELFDGSKFQVQLLGTGGQILNTRNVDQDRFQIDVNHLNGGLYVLCLSQQGKHIESIKVFKR